MGFNLLFSMLVLSLGISLMLHATTKIDVPLFRTALGIALLYVGGRVLLGAWMPANLSHEGREVFFNASRFVPRTSDEMPSKYAVVFGRGTIDLTRLAPLQSDGYTQVDVVFSEALIEIDPSTPIELRGSSVFGEVRLPNGANANFGEVLYRSPSTQPAGAPRLELRVNVVFGSATVQLRERERTPSSAQQRVPASAE